MLIVFLCVASSSRMPLQGSHSEGLLQIASVQSRALASCSPPTTPTHTPTNTTPHSQSSAQQPDADRCSQAEYSTSKQTQTSYHSE